MQYKTVIKVEQYFMKLRDQVPSDFMPFSLLTLSYFVNAQGVRVIALHSTVARTVHTRVDSDLSFHFGESARTRRQS